VWRVPSLAEIEERAAYFHGLPDERRMQPTGDELDTLIGTLKKQAGGEAGRALAQQEVAAAAAAGAPYIAAVESEDADGALLARVLSHGCVIVGC